MSDMTPQPPGQHPPGQNPPGQQPPAGAGRTPPPYPSEPYSPREGKPVSHRDLWQRLDALVGRHSVHWHVVEGKAPPEDMEYAKQLAREALADEQNS